MKQVYLTGGLGNQLFQFYVLRKMNIFQEEVKYSYVKHPHRQLEISPLIGQHVVSIARYELPKTLLINALIAKAKSRFGKMFGLSSFGRSRLFSSNVDLRRQNTGCLKLLGHNMGYFQFPQYLLDSRSEIREHFNSSVSSMIGESTFVDEIKKYDIAISMRLGSDYLNIPDMNICDYDYYKKAITEVLKKKQIENITPTFYIFSDKVDKAQEILHTLNCKCKVVTTNNPLEGLFLLSKFNNYILSNSSFAWWGMFLSQCNFDNVISPKQWSKSTLHDINLEAFVHV